MAGQLILVAGKDPFTEIGGHSSYVRAHARAALRLGLQPRLFCVAPRTEVVTTDFGPLHRVASPFRPFSQILAAGHAPLLRRALQRDLASSPGPLVIHGFGVWGVAGVSLAGRLRRRGREVVPVVSSYTTYGHEMAGKVRGVRAASHGRGRWLWQRVEMAWVRLGVDPLEARAYRDSRLILVNYDSVRDILLRQLGRTADIRRLPYAAESGFLPAPDGARRAEAARAAAAPPLIVTLSRQDPRKGVDVLLQALARLRQAGVPFRARLAGPGRLLAPHRALAQRLGLGAAVLPGFVPDRGQHLATADLFVLPSIQEGSGALALIEAMQAGLPIVASGIDGLREDICDGQNGVLVPPGDPEALAGALRALLDDPARRHRLGQAARRTYEERFAPEAFTAALGAVYQELGLRP